MNQKYNKKWYKPWKSNGTDSLDIFRISRLCFSLSYSSGTLTFMISDLYVCFSSSKLNREKYHNHNVKKSVETYC